MELRAIGTRMNDAAALIDTAFSTNTETGLRYTPEFVAACYACPGTKPELSPAFFDNERMIALLASFPRRVTLDRHEAKLALLTFNSVDPGFRQYGLGIQMVSEAVKRARSDGFDGAVFYCVSGNIANRTSVAGIKAAGVPCRQVFTLDYMMALPRPAEVAGIDYTVDPDVDTFHALADRLGQRLPLARQWSRDEIEWALGRHGAVSQGFQSGEKRGIITGSLVTDMRGTRSVQIEDVLADELEAADKTVLLKMFLEAVKGKADVVVAPLWNYIDPNIFRAAGFRRAPRRLNVYLSLWNGPEIPEQLDSMYLDVL